MVNILLFLLCKYSSTRQLKRHWAHCDFIFKSLTVAGWEVSERSSIIKGAKGKSDWSHWQGKAGEGVRSSGGTGGDMKSGVERMVLKKKSGGRTGTRQRENAFVGEGTSHQQGMTSRERSVWLNLSSFHQNLRGTSMANVSELTALCKSKDPEPSD